MIKTLFITTSKSIFSLFQGMAVTLKYLLSKPVTMQYPDQKIAMTPRFRGVVSLIIDEKTGKHRCISCLQCLRICPNYSLNLEFALDEQKKRLLTKFTIDTAKCMYCGLCVEACPTKALEMTKEHEIAYSSRDEFIRQLLK